MVMEENLIELTLNNLLVNPTGHQTSYMTSRKRIILDLETRYAKLLSTYKSFSFKIFKNKKSYIFIFKIPSETHDNFFYDVAIEFTPQDKEIEKDKNLNRYKLYLFSNSPSFTFTYTYVINNNKMLPNFVKSKCSSLALKESPKIKNPVEIYGFEKSCYYACKYIKDLGLYNKFTIETNLYLFDKSKILAKISSQDDKLKEYNLIKAKKKITKKTTTKKPKTSTKTTTKTPRAKKSIKET